MFLLKNEKTIYWSLFFVVIISIIIYTFLVFSSVSTIYAIKNSEDNLNKIIAKNSELELNYFLLKEKIETAPSLNLIANREVKYIDASLQKLVMVQD